MPAGPRRDEECQAQRAETRQPRPKAWDQVHPNAKALKGRDSGICSALSGLCCVIVSLTQGFAGDAGFALGCRVSPLSGLMQAINYAN